MTMIERVKAALATDQMRSTLAAAGLEFEPAQDVFLEMYARAAIEAMREPTDAMIAEGNAYDESAPYDIYESMIDAALSE